MEPVSATINTFTFQDDLGRTVEVEHRLDIPLPRSTMRNITLTAQEDGTAIYAWDYDQSVDDGTDEEGMPINPRTEVAQGQYTVTAEELAALEPAPLPFYRIYADEIEAKGFNFGESCRFHEPTVHIERGTAKDFAIYRHNMIVHPTDGRAALEVPTVEEWPEDDQANLVESLSADWEEAL